MAWKRTALAFALVAGGAAVCGSLMGVVTQAVLGDDSHFRTGMIVAGTVRGLGVAAAFGILLGTVAMAGAPSKSLSAIPEHRLPWRQALIPSLVIIAASFLSGSAIMYGWVIWGGIKIGRPGVMYALKGCLYTGLVLGIPIGLYGVLYLIADTQLKAYRWKAPAVVIPTVVLSYVVPASSHVGQWLLSLQVLAILIPGLATRRPWTTCLMGAAGGFVFCVLYTPVWSFARLVGRFYGLRIPGLQDDASAIFPSVIILVAVDICIAKLVVRRHSRSPQTFPRS